MTEKKALTISIIALIVSLISLFYSVLLQEHGILIGHKAYVIMPIKQISIGNDVRCLTIKMNLSVHNTGTIPIMGNKIEAFLKFNKEEYVFTTLKSFSLQPKQIWNDEVTLQQELPSDVERDRSMMRLGAVHDIMVKYHQKNDNNTPISVSNDIYQKMVDALQANTKWLSADDKYLLLIVFWINNNSDEPSERILYRFSIDREMIRLLTDFNIESYKTPDAIRNNQFISYWANPTVRPVVDRSSVDTVYNCYRNLKVAK